MESPIINHLRDFVPNLEKYKVVQKKMFRKIEIKRIPKSQTRVVVLLNLAS